MSRCARASRTKYAAIATHAIPNAAPRYVSEGSATSKLESVPRAFDPDAHRDERQEEERERAEGDEQRDEHRARQLRSGRIEHRRSGVLARPPHDREVDDRDVDRADDPDDGAQPR